MLTARLKKLRALTEGDRGNSEKRCGVQVELVRQILGNPGVCSLSSWRDSVAIVGFDQRQLHLKITQQVEIPYLDSLRFCFLSSLSRKREILWCQSIDRPSLFFHRFFRIFNHQFKMPLSSAMYILTHWLGPCSVWWYPWKWMIETCPFCSCREKAINMPVFQKL